MSVRGTERILLAPGSPFEELAGMCQVAHGLVEIASFQGHYAALGNLVPRIMSFSVPISKRPPREQAAL
jgi:hypothetical protein